MRWSKPIAAAFQAAPQYAVLLEVKDQSLRGTVAVRRCRRKLPAPRHGHGWHADSIRGGEL